MGCKGARTVIADNLTRLSDFNWLIGGVCFLMAGEGAFAQKRSRMGVGQGIAQQHCCTTPVHSKFRVIYHMPHHVKNYTNAIRPMVRCIWIKSSPEANKQASFQN